MVGIKDMEEVARICSRPASAMRGLKTLVEKMTKEIQLSRYIEPVPKLDSGGYDLSVMQRGLRSYLGKEASYEKQWLGSQRASLNIISSFYVTRVSSNFRHI